MFFDVTVMGLQWPRWCSQVFTVYLAWLSSAWGSVSPQNRSSQHNTLFPSLLSGVYGAGEAEGGLGGAGDGDDGGRGGAAAAVPPHSSHRRPGNTQG